MNSFFQYLISTDFKMRFNFNYKLRLRITTLLKAHKGSMLQASDLHWTS